MINLGQSSGERTLAHRTESFDLMRMDRKIERRERFSRYAGLTSWAALVFFGLRRRGVLGLSLAAYGAVRLWGSLAHRVELWPKPRKAERGRAGDAAIDHASWESFPASDPPGVR